MSAPIRTAQGGAHVTAAAAPKEIGQLVDDSHVSTFSKGLNDHGTYQHAGEERADRAERRTLLTYF